MDQTSNIEKWVWQNRSISQMQNERNRIGWFMEHAPGVYKVGGLGACTLISLKTIQAGVRFEKIYNLSYWGEDRHFFRAAVLGFYLYVDTHYHAFHIYRESELDGVSAYKQNNISHFNLINLESEKEWQPFEREIFAHQDETIRLCSQ